MPKEQLPGSNDPKLEARVAILEELFVRLAQAGATDNTLGGGSGSVSDQLEALSKHLKRVSNRLENIAQQLAPLRDL